MNQRRATFLFKAQRCVGHCGERSGRQERRQCRWFIFSWGRSLAGGVQQGPATRGVNCGAHQPFACCCEASGAGQAGASTLLISALRTAQLRDIHLQLSQVVARQPLTGFAQRTGRSGFARPARDATSCGTASSSPLPRAPESSGAHTRMAGMRHRWSCVAERRQLGHRLCPGVVNASASLSCHPCARRTNHKDRPAAEPAGRERPARIGREVDRRGQSMRLWRASPCPAAQPVQRGPARASASGR
jgi:hypothetical protein